jgi:glycosyltransferase involved in cell wall biosynthesis
MPPPLSVYIIARNEADRIARAIESVRRISDDIVVIEDGHSTDHTVEVARAAGARVMINPWPGFGAQKYFAEEQCKHDWVLCLDADEVVTPDLAQEIGAAISHPCADFYELTMLDVYPGAARPRLWAKGIAAVRLFRKSVGRTNQSPIHDRVDIPQGAKIGRLSAPCWHYSIRSLAHLIAKYDAYTTTQAQTIKDRNCAMLTLRLFTEYPMAFLHYYIFDRHFTGGLYGLSLSRVLANARLQRIIKLWERARG